MLNRTVSLVKVVLCSALFASAMAAFAQNIDAALFSNMEWREIGPFRGGRADAVSGVAGRPDEYYIGFCGGGVWKTTDGGVAWENVSDGFFKTGSVGAIGVS